MIADKNKGIANIAYNHLNLPTHLIIVNGEEEGEITYYYDATGVKLQKMVEIADSNQGNHTDYDSGFIYERASFSGQPLLKFFYYAEGYFEVNSPPSGELEGAYIYQYKDHTSTMLSAGLGNIRLSYKDNNGNLEIVEENNYYPFGLKHKGYNNVVNGAHYPYGFNGKEETDDLGLKWLDFGARNYDAALGRWMNIDPMAENGRGLSPYNFAFNNPVRFIDPDGMWPGYYDQYDLEWGGYMQDDWDQRHYEGQNFGNTGFDRPFDPSSKYEMQLAASQADFYEHYYDDEEDYSDYEFLDPFYLVEGNDLSEAQVKAIMDQIYSNEFYDYLDGYDFSRDGFNHRDYKQGIVATRLSLGSKGHLLKRVAKSGEVSNGVKSYTKINKFAGKALGVGSAGITIMDIAANEQINPSHAIDLVITGATLVFPGAGWVIGGTYFLVDVLVESYTDQSIGQHIDNAVGSPLYKF